MAAFIIKNRRIESYGIIFMKNIQINQILLCGTQYGQTYLPAIYAARDMELAAILARGSEHSARLAAQAGVDMYQELDAVEEYFDLALVVIGGEPGLNIAKKLLMMGVPVLIEHPLSKKAYQELAEVAEQKKVALHINSHFPELEPINSFIEQSINLTKEQAPLTVNLYANSRTLYSMLDILLRSLGSFNLEELKIDVVATNDAYSYAYFVLNGIQCHLTYQRWRGEADDSKDAPLGHQLIFVYDKGTLSLNGTYGPCIWSPLVTSNYSRSSPIYTSFTADTITKEDVTEWRVSANFKAIKSLKNVKDKGRLATHQQPEYLTLLTGLWTAFFEALGAPVMKKFEAEVK